MSKAARRPIARRPRWRQLLFLLMTALPLLATATHEPLITVEEGTHEQVSHGMPIGRVAVGDPEIADVKVINRRDLLITGKRRGVTSLKVWTAGERQSTDSRIVVRPTVNPDTQSGIPGHPQARMRVTPGVGLTGKAADLTEHHAGHQAMQSDGEPVDASVVAGPMQVQADIKVVEVNRRSLRQHGFNFLKNDAGRTLTVSPASALTGISAPGGGTLFTLQSTSGFLPLQEAFNLAFGDANDNVLAILSLLEQQGLVRTLAEPSLTVMSGQTATFLAGGEFPIPVTQGGGGGGGNTNITIEFKEFGVRLNLTPTVLSPERLVLKVAPEVSELDFSAGVQTAGVSVPALSIRRTDTTVELGDGESFVISGLVSQNMIANVDKIPYLGSIPILGAFFKSTRYSREDKELIMVVTPHLVRPIARDASHPPLPGSRHGDYDPSPGYLMGMERGDFDADGFGFSR